MFKLQNIIGFFSLIGLCSTTLAMECTLNNSNQVIYLNKAPTNVNYTFQNCKQKIISSEYQWLDSKNGHIIFKSATSPQHTINVGHTSQHFTVMGGGIDKHWDTPNKHSNKIDYLNQNVRDVEYNIMLNKNLLLPLANYRPGNYETSVKLSVNY